jgi:hypothetical protein
MAADEREMRRIIKDIDLDTALQLARAASRSEATKSIASGGTEAIKEAADEGWFG